jgi:hypothetical protein
MRAEAPPTPWDTVEAAPAPALVAISQEAPPAAAAATPWDSMGTTSGAPMPVMPAQTEEMMKAAAAKSVANSDLF